MTRLEDIIAKNRDKFDLHEPDNGHIERFRNKLSPNGISMKYLVRIAAVLIGGALILFTFQLYNNTEKVSDSLTTLSTEVQETLYYYNRKNSAMIEELKRIKTDDMHSLKAIHKDLKSNDEDFKRLLDDLGRFPEDPRVINAIIENQRSKAEMLDYILGHLKQLSV